MTSKTKRPALYDTFDYPKYWHGRTYEHEAEIIALRRFLGKIPKANKFSLIDIGGGFGRLAPVYAPIFAKCLLIDPSERLLLQAKKYLKNYPNVETLKGSVEEIPAQDGEFDVALLIRVVHHLENPYETFVEAQRVLKPGGYLILEFANKIHFRACLRAWWKTDLSFTKSLIPADQTTQKTTLVPFLNHHPRLIERELGKAGFKVVEGLSVSNFRHPLFKNLPFRALICLERFCQKPLFFCCFGPSIFFLCQKKPK